MARATLMVGLPGAGKTTAATDLEVTQPALRLTPDDWMIPLFGEPDAGGKRDVLEGRLVWVGLRAISLGIDVIWDFGCWTAAERTALRSLTEATGGTFEQRYLPITLDVALQRVLARQAADPGREVTVTDVEMRGYEEWFEAPTPEEVAGTWVSPLPSGVSSWREWAQARWPSLPSS